MDDFGILTQSIGEYAVSTVGRDNIRALELVMDPRDSTGRMSIVLSDNSPAVQRQVMASLFDVEQVFFGEAVLSFSFVNDIDVSVEEVAAVPTYTLHV